MWPAVLFTRKRRHPSPYRPPRDSTSALDAARACVPEGGNLRVVFGAGGDRDPGKRPMMGAAASEKADKIYVTSDNPRTEDPLIIMKQIMDGINHQDKAVSIVDRKVAIEQALRDAGKKDLVLIVGKGHEDYQIIGVTKIHFDDREIIRDYYHTAAYPSFCEDSRIASRVSARNSEPIASATKKGKIEQKNLNKSWHLNCS